MFNKMKDKKTLHKSRQAIRGQRAKKRNVSKATNRLKDVIEYVWPRIWRPKLITILSLGFIGLYSYNSINFDEILPIASVKIEGEFDFLNNELLQSHALPVVKGGFFNVDLSKVRGALIDLPWVENVSVRRQWPDALLVRVIEQKPVVLWGDNGVISAKGELFLPKKYPRLKLPHLSGPDGQHEMMLGELSRMQAWLLETGLYIKNIELNARRSWILTMTSGMELRLGREQMHERLNRFVSVYKETLEAKMSKNNSFKKAGRVIKYIDMRYTNGLAVAWKEA